MREAVRVWRGLRVEDETNVRGLRTGYMGRGWIGMGIDGAERVLERRGRTVVAFMLAVYSAGMICGDLQFN